MRPWQSGNGITLTPPSVDASKGEIIFQGILEIGQSL
jgi:hypothetical protein